MNKRIFDGCGIFNGILVITFTFNGISECLYHPLPSSYTPKDVEKIIKELLR